MVDMNVTWAMKDQDCVTRLFSPSPHQSCACCGTWMEDLEQLLVFIGPDSLVQIWKLKFGHKAKFLFWAREEGLVGSCSRQPTKLVYKSVSRLTLLWLPQPVRASQVPFHLLNCPPLPPLSPPTTTTHWNTFQTLHKVYKYSKMCQQNNTPYLHDVS